MSAVERRTLAVFILVFLGVLLLFIPIASAGTPKVVYGYVYYEDETPASGVNISMYIFTRPGEVLYDTTDGNGRWDQNVGNFPTGWSVGETLIIDASAPGGDDSTSMVLDANFSQKAYNMYIGWAPPADNPDVNEFIDNQTKSSIITLDLVRIALEEITNRSSADQNKISDALLTFIYWSIYDMQYYFGHMTNEGVGRPNTSVATNRVADSLADIIGPPDKDWGLSYMTHYYRVKADDYLIRDRINYTMLLTKAFMPVLGGIGTRVDDVFPASGTVNVNRFMENSTKMLTHNYDTIGMLLHHVVTTPNNTSLYDNVWGYTFHNVNSTIRQLEMMADPQQCKQNTTDAMNEAAENLIKIVGNSSRANHGYTYLLNNTRGVSTPLIEDKVEKTLKVMGNASPLAGGLMGRVGDVFGSSDPDYPTIGQFMDGTNEGSQYTFNLLGMMIDAITSRSSSEDIYESLLGLIHWQTNYSIRNLQIMTGKHRNNTTDAMDKLAENLPEVIGPPTGDSGAAYLVNSTLQGNTAKIMNLINSGMDLLGKGAPFMGYISNHTDTAFGGGDEAEIGQFADNITRTQGHVYDLLSMLLVAVNPGARSQETYDSIWGLLHCSTRASIQQLEMMTNPAKCKDNTTDALDKAVKALPDILGDRDADEGFTYILKAIASGREDYRKSKSEKTLYVVGNASSFAGGLMERVDNVFESGNPDYPTIDQFVDNSFNSTKYGAKLNSMLMNTVNNQTVSKQNDVFDSILGVIHWFVNESNRRLGLMTDPSELRDQTRNQLNITASNLPSIIGPPNATYGLAYITRKSIGSSESQDMLEQVLLAAQNTSPVLANVSQRVDDVFTGTFRKEFGNNMTIQRAYIYDLLSLLVQSIQSGYEHERNQIYNSILGYTHWLTFSNLERYEILVNPIKLQSTTMDTMDAVLNDLPEIIGPPNATYGYTYISETIRGSSDTLVEEKMQRLLELQENATPFISGLLNQYPYVFGWTSRSIWGI